MLKFQQGMIKFISMLKIIVICFVILSYFHGDATQATLTSCPERPASDMRGPPGIPGRKGEPGYGKYSRITRKSLFMIFL